MKLANLVAAPICPAWGQTVHDQGRMAFKLVSLAAVPTCHSMDGNSSSWFAEDGFQPGDADLPQTAEVSNVAGLNSPGSDFADFGDVPTRTIETAEASAIPSMGTTSSPRSAHEVGESGGSVHLPQDANMPSMGATDSPRSGQDGIQVGESGGSSHLHQDATLPSMDGNSSSWFAEDGFQVGESGGSADLPQTAEVSNVAGLNSPGSDFADFGDVPTRTIETAEASAIPSMGTTSSPRSAHEVGESGGSVHLPQDANMPSMGATDSPRSRQDGIQVGESGGSSHLHQDATLPSMDGNSSSWFAEDGFQVGESGGSADLPQTAEVSNVAGLNSPGSDFADFGDVPTRTIETAEASAIPSMGTTSSLRSAHEVGESGGSVHLPQENTSQPGDVGGPPSMDASRIPITTERPRGDIGGDDRAGHPSGSGGSGGSGDRPGGYPAALALDPGGTDEVEASGDERRIPEAALPTGATEPKFEPHGHGMQNCDIVLCILDWAMMTSARIFTQIHTHTHTPLYTSDIHYMMWFYTCVYPIMQLILCISQNLKGLRLLCKNPPVEVVLKENLAPKKWMMTMTSVILKQIWPQLRKPEVQRAAWKAINRHSKDWGLPYLKQMDFRKKRCNFAPYTLI